MRLLGKAASCFAAATLAVGLWPGVGLANGASSSAQGAEGQQPSIQAKAEKAAAPAERTVKMLRVYNPNTGEHFYTGSASERDGLVSAGWHDEGVAWVSPETSDTPVYRLYSGTDHYYTTDRAERDALKGAGWKSEGIGWYSDDSRRVKVYQQFNPNVNPNAKHNNSGSHNFTTSADEGDSLKASGWRKEGVAWYACKVGALKPYEGPDAGALRAELGIREDYRAEFDHGFKGADWQSYIVLHDTEGEGVGENVIAGWASEGRRVAAHFIVEKDGTVWQCVDMDRIAHHAGYGDTGHNALYGVEDESRDDFGGTVPIGAWAVDYGMNSHSIGIEMVHVGGSGGYPEVQLEALDRLIVYIDAYYGFESEIIDHKAWRSGNSDTSAEFAGYLANYQARRHH